MLSCSRSMLCAGSFASAHEYSLQFTPQSGARGLVVAGYRFIAKTVVGNCSYYTQSACSGRGCHPPPPTHHNSTCTWDLYGNLLSMMPGGIAAPQPLYQTGTEIVYAVSGRSTTGIDTWHFGFVATPSAHYTWETLNGGYADIADAVYPIEATIISDGDFALNVAGARVVTRTYGTYTPTPGNAVVSANTCRGSLAPGSHCIVTISYNPTTISCTGSPYGYAYTGIDLSLVTNAGANTDLVQRFTVIGVPVCDD